MMSKRCWKGKIILQIVDKDKKIVYFEILWEFDAEYDYVYYREYKCKYRYI